MRECPKRRSQSDQPQIARDHESDLPSRKAENRAILTLPRANKKGGHFRAGRLAQTRTRGCKTEGASKPGRAGGFAAPQEGVHSEYSRWITGKSIPFRPELKTRGFFVVQLLLFDMIDRIPVER